MIFSQEDERRLSEAAANAVTSIAEAVEGIASAAKACGVYVCEMVSGSAASGIRSKSAYSPQTKNSEKWRPAKSTTS